MTTTTRPGADALLRSDLQVRQLDLTDPADVELFRRGNAVELAAHVALFGDRHGVREADEQIAADLTGTAHRTLRWVGLLGDEVVGALGVGMPLRDNLATADVDVTVAPAHQRAGIGTTLLALGERSAREHGRSVLQSWVAHPIDEAGADPAAAFAARSGWEPTLPSLRSDLDLPAELDGPALDALLAPLDAEVAGVDLSDYRLLTWWDGCPEEWLDDRALLMRRMSTDAPIGDAVMEEEDWDAERVREQYRVAAAQRRSVVETAALHVPSGRLAAFTMIGLPDDDARTKAFQWDTLVLSEHRGRRLGMAVKAANLRALLTREPQVRRVTTYNASSNAPMLRVNFAMGFTPVQRTNCWQKVLGG